MTDSPHAAPRKFLVVVDKTPECKVALRFATRRAQHTGGRVTLICVAAPGDIQQWRGVEEIMREEAHEEAEAALHDAAKLVNELSGQMPELVIEHGDTAECVMNLIRSDKDISILVLASGTSKEGPGPLVTLVAGPQAGAYPIPVTIVPGSLSDAAVDALA
ncbi:MAG: universal stress protein [Alphaproteobacteria bacterium]|nr:universal stress protein [Alphaproteobacteria bacterium]MBU6472314.1 universal stress protein [Alphaproteobacteria bacterium]MDE2014245.1 universal stress protein [Alphaproteobacteria bacterium]MDE2074218.1 universal stress protein [Alphaproteobacteria bacterium]